MTARLRQISRTHFRLEGELTQLSVPKLWEAARAVLAAVTEDIHLDLNDVIRVDSAGLALLIDWVREVEAQTATVIFKGAPTQLLALARAYAVDDVLRLNTTPD